MAKGQVIEHLGDGKYRVSLKFGIERIQQELADLNERIAELAVLVPNAKTDLLLAEDAAKAKAAQIDAAIPDYQNGVEGALQTIRALQVELVHLQGELQKARFKADQLIAENLSLLKRRSQLERLPAEETRDLWCADYVTDASGEVGLIEVNDEGAENIIMQPAFSDEGGYLASRDGQLVPRAGQSGAQVYFNAAILPGIQKWRPRYRVGTLTAIDGGLANVTLDEATSSAQNLNINQAGILKKIPIQYMDCDATAFEVGDRVLVRWFDSGPQVVGFESNPKPCFGHGLVFCPSQAQLNGDRTFWGLPFEDGAGNEINPPLGTTLGSNPVWSIQKRREDSPIKSAKGLEYNYGLRNWIGTNGTRDILSWRGPASRVFDWYNNFGETINVRIPNFQTRWRRSSEVFYKLTVLVDLTDYTLGGFTKVCGASMYYEGETAFLLVVATDADEWSPGPDYRVYEWELNRQFEATGSPTLKQSFTVDPDIYPLTDWYFDGSGKRAVCTLRNQKLQESDPADYNIIYKAEYTLAGGFSIASVWDATTLPSNEVQQFGQYLYRAIRREEGSPACGPTKLGVSWDEKNNAVNNTTRPADSIPLYFDYRGLDQVGAYYSKPET
ncbi:MAG: hypothetical protein R3193_14305, partial [Marinobacter sp.]|nr:hypothetical protein [Marinobacter sp.]